MFGREYSFKIKKKELKRLKPCQVLPENLSGKSINCQRCLNTFIPDWLGIRQPPTAAVFANGRWAQCVSMEIDCLKCGNKVPVEFPRNKGVAGKARIFIDEAVRDEEEYKLVCYSSVRCNEADLEKLTELNKTIRNKIAEHSGIYPEHALHMTDIWSRSKKGLDAAYLGLSQESALDILNFAMKQIADANFIKVYSSVFKFEHSKFPKQLKTFDIVNTALLQIVIGETTASALIPDFIYEDDGKFGRITNLFKSIFCSLSFPFISNGLPMKLPHSVQKSSGTVDTFGTEIADIVCFCVARAINKSCLVEQCEFDLKHLGEVAYILLDKDGGINLERTIGIPTI